MTTRGDRPDEVARLIRSIEASTITPRELIIVDQSPTGAMGRFGQLPEPPFEIQVIGLPGLQGCSLGRNTGLAVARGDYVTFPDDDCWYPPDALNHAVAHLERHPDHAAITGRPSWVGEGDAHATARFMRTAHSVAPRQALRAGSEITLFLRTDLLRKSGGFDEQFGAGSPSPWQAGESVLLITGMLRRGFTVWFDPLLTVNHPRPTHVPAKAIGYQRGVGCALRVSGLHWMVGAVFIARPAIGAGLAMASCKPDLAQVRWAAARSRWKGWSDGQHLKRPY